MNKKTLLVIIFFVQVSCSSLSEVGKVLRNEKINSTDEFLVKKNEPLVMPPDYKKLPEPGSLSKNTTNEEEKIKKILKGPNQSKKNTNKASSVEESILNSIRK